MKSKVFKFYYLFQKKMQKNEPHGIHRLPWGSIFIYGEF